MKPLFTIVIMAVFCGCNGETMPQSEPIRFELKAGIPGTVDSRTIVTGTTLPEGSKAGVFGYSYEGTNQWSNNPDIYHNAPATVGTPGSNNRNALTIEQKEYTWNKHAFYAYYPYIDGLTAADPLIEGDLFATTITDTDGQIDWLWSDPVTDLTATANPVRLVFRHKLTLIPILTAKTNDVGVELRLEEITFETTASQRFTFNIATGEMQDRAGGKTTYTIMPAENNGIIPDLETGETEATEVMDNLLLLPETTIKAIVLRVNGQQYATPADWEGFDATKAGEYRMMSIVMGISEIIISIGTKEWGEGEITDFTAGQLLIQLGAKGWEYNPADDTDFTAATVVISIGKQGWKDNENPIPTK